MRRSPARSGARLRVWVQGFVGLKDRLESVVSTREPSAEETQSTAPRNATLTHKAFTMGSIAETATNCKGNLGHNGGPPLSIRNFKRRWAAALFAHPEKPFGAVAMGFKIYMEMDNRGEGAVISDDEFKASCGVSDGSCRTFKKWLIDHQFIRIRVRGQRGRKSTFQAIIPGEPIPADVAAIPEEIAAPIAVNQQNQRQPLPAMDDLIPADVAASGEIPAAIAGNLGEISRARARIENPSGLNIYTEVESEEKEEKGKVSALDALRAFERYNELAQRVGLPIAKSLTPERRKALIKRMNDHGGVAAWESVLSNIARSKFLQGNNERGWRPTGLDWFLKPANFTKVIEGAYGNGAHAEPKESVIERTFRFCQEASERLHSKGVIR